jgi:acetylornithine deacetylase/succinyl-diaminopimelate desuccinylase-like protein
MEKTIKEAVAEKIKECGEEVANTVINKLAEVEISRRVDLIMKGINHLEKLEKEWKKVDGKKDVITYNDAGEKIETMSKARWEEIKKAKEKVDKMTKAIDSALKDNTTDAYNKLSDLVKNAGNTKEGTTESTE